MSGRALVTGETGFVGGRPARRLHGVARPLIEGLSTPTTVTDPTGMELFDLRPIGFDEALRRAVADDPELQPCVMVASEAIA